MWTGCCSGSTVVGGCKADDQYVHEDPGDRRFRGTDAPASAGWYDVHGSGTGNNMCVPVSR